MKERILKILKGQAATSVVYVILGLCLTALPVGTVYNFCKVVFGLVLVICGIYHVYGYFRKKPGTMLLDLFSGVILLVISGFLFFNPQVVIKILPVLLGAFVLIDSIWTLQSALELKKQGAKLWKVFLIGSLLFIGLGIVLMINPFSVVKYTVLFAGITLLANGIVDIVFLILKRRTTRKTAQVSAASAETDPAVSPGSGTQEAEGRDAGGSSQQTESADEPSSDTLPSGEGDNAEEAESAAAGAVDAADDMQAEDSLTEQSEPELTLDPQIREEISKPVEVAEHQENE